MTVPINTFADILTAMEQNPQLRDMMRQHILTEELLQLPAVVVELAQALREYMAATNQRLERLETDVAEIKDRQTRMEGTLTRLTGSDYERKAARRAARLARRYLNLPNATVSYALTAPDNNLIPDLTDRAVADGRITDEQADELENADIILIDHGAGIPAYAVVEVSITIDDHDISRARNRADLLAQVSNATVRAAAIGTAILDTGRRLAAQQNVTVIILPE